MTISGDAPISPSPVTPNATLEARHLLSFLYSLHGRVTLSGQHNQMYHMSEPSDRIQALTGKYPLIWGGEWGFSDERHDIDNIKYRPRLLEEIRKQHAAGRIVVLTYHQGSPTVGEPCDFKGGVQLATSEAEWEDILTEGTDLHKVWAQQVDLLAEVLKSLQDIPIIFRPYHEMNGAWFWWGANPPRFKALWAMLFHRFTVRHRLNNLLWAWNPDRPWPDVGDYYPGHETVDLLGTDIYPLEGQTEVYPQEWYDRMLALAEGRPLALSEMSVLPSAEVLERQPWSYFMAWDDLVFAANSEEAIRAAYGCPGVVSDSR